MLYSDTYFPTVDSTCTAVLHSYAKKGGRALNQGYWIAILRRKFLFFFLDVAGKHEIACHNPYVAVTFHICSLHVLYIYLQSRSRLQQWLAKKYRWRAYTYPHSQTPLLHYKNGLNSLCRILCTKMC